MSFVGKHDRHDLRPNDVAGDGDGGEEGADEHVEGEEGGADVAEDAMRRLPRQREEEGVADALRGVTAAERHCGRGRRTVPMTIENQEGVNRRIRALMLDARPVMYFDIGSTGGEAPSFEAGSPPFSAASAGTSLVTASSSRMSLSVDMDGSS